MLSMLLAAYAALVVRVVDGDSVIVHVPAWDQTPFAVISVRVLGIDTPETHKPPGKCKAELVKGAAAKAYALALMPPGTPLTVTYHHWDKYGGRIDADLTLQDGRDFGQAIVAQGLARPYDGGKKASWCH